MCQIDFDGDACKLWREVPRIAARLHTCDCCRVLVTRGEPYLAHSNLFDGQWTREAMCFSCWWIREAFIGLHAGLIPTPSMVEEVIRECYEDEENPRWRAALVGIYRRRIQLPTASPLPSASS